MPKCPDCDSDTVKRLAVIEPSELQEERDYCLTCDGFLDEDARPVPESE